MTDPTQHCWSCQNEIGNPETDISLTGLTQDAAGNPMIEYHVCQGCWCSMSPFQHVLLAWLFKTKIQGGSGIAETAAAVLAIIEQTQGEYRPLDLLKRN